MVQDHSKVDVGRSSGHPNPSSPCPFRHPRIASLIPVPPSVIPAEAGIHSDQRTPNLEFRRALLHGGHRRRRIAEAGRSGTSQGALRVPEGEVTPDDAFHLVDWRGKGEEGKLPEQPAPDAPR